MKLEYIRHFAFVLLVIVIIFSQYNVYKTHQLNNELFDSLNQSIEIGFQLKELHIEITRDLRLDIFSLINENNITFEQCRPNPNFTGRLCMIGESIARCTYNENNVRIGCHTFTPKTLI